VVKSTEKVFLSKVMERFMKEIS